MMNIEDILANDISEELFEITGDLPVHIWNSKIRGSKVFLWGCIQEIEGVLHYFKGQNIKVSAIIDKDISKKGKFIENIEIITPTDLEQMASVEDKYIFILTAAFISNRDYFEKIMDDANVGFFYTYVSKEDIKRITGISHWRQNGRVEYYRNNKEALIHVDRMWSDEESRKVYRLYLQCIMCNRFYNGKEINSRYKYFFDYGMKPIYRHLEGEEVWVNCGAAKGDTIFAYYANGLNPKEVHAFEGDKDSFKSLEYNISLLPDLLRSKTKIYNEFIDSNTRFDTILEHKCTLINADIEGAEMELLQSMENIIKRDRPVVAICMYHKKEDFINITDFLYKLDGYKYYLRKYTSWIGCVTRWTELVMYAVPNERCVEDDIGMPSY